MSFRKGGSTGLPMSLPCGRCDGCRLERSRQWAVRCMHEASLYAESSFVTLTYDEEHLPLDGGLDVEAIPEFVRRYRKRCGAVRYFACGEYGETHGRPHYHALLFGAAFPDREKWRENNGRPLFRSQELERLWPYGSAELGAVTFESAAYVARYTVKKQRAKEAYERVALDTGEVFTVAREFARMSRRPGIGAEWYRRYGKEVFPADEVVVRGSLAKPPRYYQKLLERVSPEVSETVKRARARGRRRGDETAERLQVREVCQAARMNLFARSLE